MSKPVFVFVPGAWHGPECFEPVANVLKQSGYDSTYITLKSVGATPPVKGFEPDVELVRNSVQQLLDEGKDVVLVMHSYGGAPGQQAAGELKESKGKLIRMAWITAFVFQEGQTLMAMLGGNPLPWFIVKSEDEVDAADPRQIFYNDMSDEAAAAWIPRLKTQSYRVMSSAVTNESWTKYPSAYLVCDDDQAIPYQAQEGMIAGIQARNPKAFDIVEKIKASHSPFLSQPDATAKFLVKCAV